MEQNDSYKSLLNSAEDFFETQKRLTNLYIVEKVSAASSALASNLIMFFIFLMMFLFLNLAIAYIIAEFTGKIYIGFVSVCCLYLLIGIVVYIKRNSWIKTPITNSIITKLLDDEE
jgi:hypothetical protein